MDHQGKCKCVLCKAGLKSEKKGFVEIKEIDGKPVSKPTYMMLDAKALDQLKLWLGATDAEVVH